MSTTEERQRRNLRLANRLVYVAAVLAYIWFLWDVAQWDSPHMWMIGSVFVGLGLVIDGINVVLSVARLLGQRVSPIGGVPLLMYLFGVPLLCHLWLGRRCHRARVS